MTSPKGKVIAGDAPGAYRRVRRAGLAHDEEPGARQAHGVDDDHVRVATDYDSRT